MQKLQKDERYQRYLNKYKLADKEPPLKIVQDDQGELWIIDICLDGIKAREYELVIPDFVSGFVSIDDIQGEFYGLETTGNNTGEKEINNFCDIIDSIQRKKSLGITLFADMMLARLNKYAFDLGTLIINGNNIPLKGTLSKAFYGTICDKIVFKNFDAQNIQDLRQAFKNSAFKYIDFTEFKVGNQVNMESMLCGCINLENVDLQSLNSIEAIQIEKMFFGCNALKSIKLPEISLLGIEPQLHETFGNCWSLSDVNSENIKYSYGAP